MNKKITNKHYITRLLEQSFKRYSLVSLLCTFSFITACGNGSQIENTESNQNGKDSVATTGDVTMYVTTSARSYDLTKRTLKFDAKQSMSPSTITLQPATTYQSIDGFGAALTGSSCFNLMQMTQENRTKFLTETFSPTSGYGFSYIRVTIGSSDFSLGDFTCCDTKGIENFMLQAEDRSYVIPVLKEIVAINPNIKIMGSPWTCPKWMKVEDLTTKSPHDSYKGGRLNPDYYQDYATYFVKWIQAFQNEGIKIYSITPQNEPRYAYNSSSLYLEWDEECSFVKNALYPALQKAGLKTKIYAWDHNYDGYDYPLKVMGSDAAKCFAGSAWHDYGGKQDALNAMHDEFPDKEIIFTESSIGTWNAGRDLTKRLLPDMENLLMGNVKNWSRGVIVWNLMLDNERGPNLGKEGGCSTCYGAVDINYDYKTITRNSHYYIIAHASSVVKTGAVRIGTTGYESSDIAYQAFRNSDASYAFLIVNKASTTKTIVVSDGTHSFTCALPALSVVSALWK